MARKSKKSSSQPEDKGLPADSRAEDAVPEPPEEAFEGPPELDEPPPLKEDSSSAEGNTAEGSASPVIEELSGPQETPDHPAPEEPTPESDTTVLPPIEPAASSKKETFVRPGSLFLLLLVLGLSGGLYYQNQKTAKSAENLKSEIAALEARIGAAETNKMDEKSGVLIAQAVKSLREEIAGLKKIPPASSAVAPAPLAPPEAQNAVDEAPAPVEVPDSEIAVDPHLTAEKPEMIEGSGEEEPAEEMEAAQESADSETAQAPDAEEEEAAAEEEAPGEAVAEEEAPQEAAAAEDSPEETATEEENHEEPAEAEPAPEIETAHEPVEEKAAVAHSPETKTPKAEKTRVERTPVVRDYLNFIEDSARRFTDLIKKGFARTRDTFSSPQG